VGVSATRHDPAVIAVEVRQRHAERFEDPILSEFGTGFPESSL
jgi:hypothetical protein